MEPLKEMFNDAYYKNLARILAKTLPGFDSKAFLTKVMKDIEARSLNERMRHTSVVLREQLPPDFVKSLEVLKEAIPHTPRGYTNLLFPDFVGLYGLDHFSLSMDALKYFTSFGSSEFAVRHFLKKDMKKALGIMKQWAGDKDHHVRRLASEGSRPRLPWSFKLDAVIADPSLTTPILEQLNRDPELYVRKSVANHLNDISKDHPDHLLKVVKGWDRSHPHTAWIAKHASRSLIKKGHSGSLAVFDFEKDPKLRLSNLKLKSKKIRLGETLDFSFELSSEKNQSQKLVVDYIIHYRKSSGELSPKVFKLTELNLQPGATVSISKKQVIKDFTTRQHFAGKHLLAIQVNGKVLSEISFHLDLK